MHALHAGTVNLCVARRSSRRTMRRLRSHATRVVLSGLSYVERSGRCAKRTCSRRVRETGDGAPATLAARLDQQQRRGMGGGPVSLREGLAEGTRDDRLCGGNAHAREWQASRQRHEQGYARTFVTLVALAAVCCADRSIRVRRRVLGSVVTSAFLLGRCRRGARTGQFVHAKPMTGNGHLHPQHSEQRQHGDAGVRTVVQRRDHATTIRRSRRSSIDSDQTADELLWPWSESAAVRSDSSVWPNLRRRISSARVGTIIHCSTGLSPRPRSGIVGIR